MHIRRFVWILCLVISFFPSSLCQQRSESSSDSGTSPSELPEVRWPPAASTSITGVPIQLFRTPECENETVYYLARPTELSLPERQGTNFTSHQESDLYVFTFRLGLPSAFDNKFKQYLQENGKALGRRDCDKDGKPHNFVRLQSPFTIGAIFPSFVTVHGQSNFHGVPGGLELQIEKNRNSDFVRYLEKGIEVSYEHTIRVARASKYMHILTTCQEATKKLGIAGDLLLHHSAFKTTSIAVNAAIQSMKKEYDKNSYRYSYSFTEEESAKLFLDQLAPKCGLEVHPIDNTDSQSGEAKPNKDAEETLAGATKPLSVFSVQVSSRFDWNTLKDAQFRSEEVLNAYPHRLFDSFTLTDSRSHVVKPIDTQVQANSEQWRHLGTLVGGVHYVLIMEGRWKPGKHTGFVDACGEIANMAGNDFMLPGKPTYSLLLKVISNSGSETFLECGQQPRMLVPQEEDSDVWAVMNDKKGAYGDNQGYITIKLSPRR